MDGEIDPDAERGNEDDFWLGQSRQIKCMGQHRAEKYDGFWITQSQHGSGEKARAC